MLLKFVIFLSLIVFLSYIFPVEGSYLDQKVRVCDEAQLSKILNDTFTDDADRGRYLYLLKSHVNKEMSIAKLLYILYYNNYLNLSRIVINCPDDNFRFIDINIELDTITFAIRNAYLLTSYTSDFDIFKRLLSDVRRRFSYLYTRCDPKNTVLNMYLSYRTRYFPSIFWVPLNCYSMLVTYGEEMFPYYREVLNRKGDGYHIDTEFNLMIKIEVISILSYVPYLIEDLRYELIELFISEMDAAYNHHKLYGSPSYYGTSYSNNVYFLRKKLTDKLTILLTPQPAYVHLSYQNNLFNDDTMHCYVYHTLPSSYNVISSDILYDIYDNVI
jgi:hypothetical protein